MIALVDAMGGDNAPYAIVKGCVDAVNERDGFSITLIGDEGEIRKILSSEKYVLRGSQSAIRQKLLRMTMSLQKRSGRRVILPLLLDLKCLRQERVTYFYPQAAAVPC